MSVSRKVEVAAVSTSFDMSFAGSDPVESIHATLSYNVFEPYAVTASFVMGDAPAVKWVMARDLLREGIVLPSGLGDIKLFPIEEGLILELHSPSGRAVLHAPIEPVLEFVHRIYQVVPADREHEFFSVDAELDLLSGLYSVPENGPEA